MVHEHVDEKCPCCGDLRTPKDNSFDICKKCRPKVNQYTKEYKARGMTSGHYTKAKKRVAEENKLSPPLSKARNKKTNKNTSRKSDGWRTLSIPKNGVYFLRLKDKIQYIGKAEQNKGGINARVGAHMREGKIPFDNVKYFELPANEVDKTERRFIQTHNPPYNKKGVKQ